MEDRPVFIRYFFLHNIIFNRKEISVICKGFVFQQSGGYTVLHQKHNAFDFANPGLRNWSKGNVSSVLFLTEVECLFYPNL